MTTRAYIAAVAIAAIACTRTAPATTLSTFNFTPQTVFASPDTGTLGIPAVAAVPAFHPSATASHAVGDDLATSLLRITALPGRIRRMTSLAGTSGFPSLGLSFAGIVTAKGWASDPVRDALDRNPLSAFGGVPSTPTFGGPPFDPGSLLGPTKNETTALQVALGGAFAGGGSFRFQMVPIIGPSPIALVPLPTAAVAGLVVLGVGGLARRLRRPRRHE